MSAGYSSGASAAPVNPSSATTSSSPPAPLAPYPISKRIPSSPGNAATKARFEPINVHEYEAGWGVVRVFRDDAETPGLYGFDAHQPSLNPPAAAISRLTVSDTRSVRSEKQALSAKDEECTTLCILAVPSYMSPADFMGWVGEKTREEVSHFRLIRTERANRYMALMRFRSGRRARDWRKEWNGASFDAAVPETAQIVFVKSIEFMSEQSASFPDIDDPLSGKNIDGISKGSVAGSIPPSLSVKPLAPPTPSLVEMPTCPVCLERMDESTGLLTIQCQHVFHCTCLHKWRGSGCPVCRFTHDGLAGRRLNGQADEESSEPNECSICHSGENLWICLICGNVGCGRYDAAHAFMHWQHSDHAFSMDMTTQRIWDYNSDAYVHRIVQNKLDGKIMQKDESQESDHVDGVESTYYGDDYVPREKSDAIGREYTALLSSQLESQRFYYEEKVNMAADKASQASLAATQAAEAASMALDQLARLQEEHQTLVEKTIPALERDKDRVSRRADKAQEMARKFEKEWREEKAVNEGLLERVKKLDTDIVPLKAENADLKEMNRDLQFFISSQQKVSEMGEEVAEGAVSLPEEKKKNRKGKKKAANT